MVTCFQVRDCLLKLIIFRNVILHCLAKEGLLFFRNCLETVIRKACQFLSVIHIIRKSTHSLRIYNQRAHPESSPQSADTLSVGKLLWRGK